MWNTKRSSMHGNKDVGLHEAELISLKPIILSLESNSSISSKYFLSSYTTRFFVFLGWYRVGDKLGGTQLKAEGGVEGLDCS